MQIVYLAALGVGGATIFGAVIGYLFKGLSKRFGNIILAFAAGVMLAAASFGLIVPAIEAGGKYGVITTILGVFTGAVLLTVLQKIVPHMLSLIDNPYEKNDSKHFYSVLLFVAAIAIHNFPEGIAAGVGFASGDTLRALTVASGIALQNLPEGMVVISPMISIGFSPRKAFLIALGTGVVEIVGTILGYFALTFFSGLVSFGLAFAAGTMLYIINDDMIPTLHENSHCCSVTYAMLAGFCIMLAFDAFI